MRRFNRSDEPFKIADLSCGRQPWQSVSVYAFTEADIGSPMVGLGNDLDDNLGQLTPDQAEKLAIMLMDAAIIARGLRQRPNPLQDFLDRQP